MREIRASKCHNHPVSSAETMRYVKPSNDVKESFLSYFNLNMGINESCRYHSNVTNMTEEEKASGRVNPPYRIVQHWYDSWRKENFGPRIEDGVFEVCSIRHWSEKHFIITIF